MAIICQERKPSQEPRLNTGIMVKMKVTVERKKHETEGKSQSLPSGKASKYSPPKKEALVPFILKFHPNSNPDSATD